ncbi:hypothetical protein O9K51_07957 [Purpureocillium lavendulum]|uniref:Uncharacterized protein n=1 Tax=Purpureocillium lavendulum TaxID=1247861 RepID=A0AB34FNW2_9HYPO|nr:hypothetical protein O9K51_07957 [Purpureocillium lavendulum]
MSADDDHSASPVDTPEAEAEPMVDDDMDGGDDGDDASSPTDEEPSYDRAPSARPSMPGWGALTTWVRQQATSVPWSAPTGGGRDEPQSPRHAGGTLGSSNLYAQASPVGFAAMNIAIVAGFAFISLWLLESIVVQSVLGAGRMYWYE